MTTHIEALKLALDALTVLLDEWTPARQAQLKGMAAVTAIKEALAQPEQELIGKVKELFTQSAWERLDLRGSTKVYTTPPQRKPLTLWTEAQHERAYRNSPELHKDVKSLAAFKRVAKEIAAMYGIAPQGSDK